MTTTKILLTDALLGLKTNEVKGKVNEIDIIKTAYRYACSKYHPDRNPSGLEMMKLINAAWEALKDANLSELKDDKEGTEFYGEEINAALSAIINLGLTIEICGSWVWVSGYTHTHKDILKQNGY